MQPRRLPYIDEEEIVVKPSTELIADEYEHSLKSTKNIDVHTFSTKYSHDKDSVNLFIETLNKNSYQIESKHNHCLDKDAFFKVLHEIQQYGSESESPDGLILYFSGFCRGKMNGNRKEGYIDVFDGEKGVTVNIQDIWTRFTADKCPALKNKPKIFIFQITFISNVEMDGKRHMFTTYNETYETPTEADILIVYNKSDASSQTDFIEQLCENIDNYGKSEDIISLVTCINSDVFETRPIIISTLTRKFFFTASDYRGLHLDIDESHKQLKKDLAELKAKLMCDGNNKPEKKKTRFSFMTRSFKNRQQVNPKEAPSEVTIAKSNGIKGNNVVSNSSKKVLNVKLTSKSESDGRKPRWSFTFSKRP